MAIRHISTQLCDNLIKHDDGRVSLIGVFQNIKPRQIPAVKDPMGIVVVFRGEPGDPFQVFVRGPRGFEIAFPADVVGPPPPGLEPHQQWSSTYGALLTPAVFPRAGVYKIALESGGRRIHTYPFGVLKAKTEPVE